MRRSVVVLIRLALLAVVLGVWEALPRAGIVNPILLPPLSDVVTTLAQIVGRGDVREAVVVTAAEVVPSMMPILLETLRVAMIFNLTGVLIAEMYASRTGIGNLLANWGENFQMPRLFAGVLLLAAAAMSFNAMIRSLEARCSTWRT